MKAKKALKRLARVEALLSTIIDKYTAAGERRVQGLLSTAKKSVVHAEKALNSRTSTAAAKKPPGRANNAERRGLTAAGRKRLSLAAKERWAAAKRKGIHGVTGRPLKRTA